MNILGMEIGAPNATFVLAGLRKAMEKRLKYPVSKYEMIYIAKNEVITFKLFPPGKPVRMEPYEGEGKKIIIHTLKSFSTAALKDNGGIIDIVTVKYEHGKGAELIVHYTTKENLKTFLTHKL